MAFASNANSKVAYKLETTYGTNPGGNFDYAQFYTSSLTPNTQSMENDEITPDRLAAGAIITDIAASGQLVVPFVPNDQDDFIQAAMLAAWAPRTSRGDRRLGGKATAARSRRRDWGYPHGDE